MRCPVVSAEVQPAAVSRLIVLIDVVIVQDYPVNVERHESVSLTYNLEGVFFAYMYLFYLIPGSEAVNILVSTYLDSVMLEVVSPYETRRVTMYAPYAEAESEQLVPICLVFLAQQVTTRRREAYSLPVFLIRLTAHPFEAGGD